MAQEELDLRGLKCPLPALMVRKRLRTAAAGEEIRVLTDDPMAPIDVPHMCRQEGFDVVDVARDGDIARMVLKRPA
ncbi:MAG TPA: sulfurtransferase TusA family protein [Rhizomicrobium sp.]